MRQKFLSSSQRENLLQFVLLNAYATENQGLNIGKAGIALALFEMSGHAGMESLEQHAFDLFQHALVTKSRNISLTNGLAGVALDHLIRNRFIDAKFQDIFGKQQQFICHALDSGAYSCKNPSEWCEYLFFVCMTRQYMPSDLYRRIELFLTSRISIYYDQIQKKGAEGREGSELATCSSLLLYMNSCTGRYVELAESIGRIYMTPGKGNSHWNVGYYLCKNGLKRGRDTEAGMRMMERMIDCAIPQLMDLRQKLNVLYYLNASPEMKQLAGAERLVERLLKEIVVDPVSLFELKLTDSISDKIYYYGLGRGVCRLLCVDRYWKVLAEGKEVPLLEWLCI